MLQVGTYVSATGFGLSAYQIPWLRCPAGQSMFSQPPWARPSRLGHVMKPATPYSICMAKWVRTLFGSSPFVSRLLVAQRDTAHVLRESWRYASDSKDHAG